MWHWMNSSSCSCAVFDAIIPFVDVKGSCRRKCQVSSQRFSQKCFNVLPRSSFLLAHRRCRPSQRVQRRREPGWMAVIGPIWICDRRALIEKEQNRTMASCQDIADSTAFTVKSTIESKNSLARELFTRAAFRKLCQFPQTPSTKSEELGSSAFRLLLRSTAASSLKVSV